MNCVGRYLIFIQLSVTRQSPSDRRRSSCSAPPGDSHFTLHSAALVQRSPFAHHSSAVVLYSCLAWFYVNRWLGLGFLTFYNRPWRTGDINVVNIIIIIIQPQYQMPTTVTASTDEEKIPRKIRKLGIARVILRS